MLEIYALCAINRQKALEQRRRLRNQLRQLSREELESYILEKPWSDVAKGFLEKKPYSQH